MYVQTMQLWLKNIGASEDRIKSKRWYDQGSDDGEFRWHVRFSEQYAGRSIASGDLLLYHAFVDGLAEGRVVGVARISSDAPTWKPRSTPMGGYKEVQPGPFNEAVRRLAANAMPTP